MATEKKDKTKLKVIQNPKEENKIELTMKQREVKIIIRINKRKRGKKEYNS